MSNIYMHNLLGEVSQGIVFIVSAPAGTGKTTLVRKLCCEFPSVMESVSYTTRPRREGEQEGKDYFFVTPEEFQKKVSSKDFLEYAKVFNSYYGTNKKDVEELRCAGKHIVLVIDTQGAFHIMEQMETVSIFIKPPNLKELKRRLVDRQSENEAAVIHRFSWAKHELAMALKYDYQIVNDELDLAYEVLRSIVIAETHHTKWSGRR